MNIILGTTCYVISALCFQIVGILPQLSKHEPPLLLLIFQHVIYYVHSNLIRFLRQRLSHSSIRRGISFSLFKLHANCDTLRNNAAEVYFRTLSAKIFLCRSPSKDSEIERPENRVGFILRVIHELAKTLKMFILLCDVGRSDSISDMYHKKRSFRLYALQEYESQNHYGKRTVVWICTVATRERVFHISIC